MHNVGNTLVNVTILRPEEKDSEKVLIYQSQRGKYSLNIKKLDGVPEDTEQLFKLCSSDFPDVHFSGIVALAKMMVEHGFAVDASAKTLFKLRNLRFYMAERRFDVMKGWISIFKNEWVKTLGICFICTFLARIIVLWLWPIAREWEFVTTLNEIAAEKFAVGTAFYLFLVVTHMNRGKLDGNGLAFTVLYLLACLLFAFSTIPPSQYNTGTATIEVAFCFLLLHTAWRELHTKLTMPGREDFYEFLRTLGICLLYTCVSYFFVSWFWPQARNTAIVVNLSAGTAGKIAILTAFYMMVVVAHMKRKQLDPASSKFRWMYGLACLFFAGSTIPIAQNNHGTAVIEIAFALMLWLSAFWQKFVESRGSSTVVIAD